MAEFKGFYESDDVYERYEMNEDEAIDIGIKFTYANPEEVISTFLNTARGVKGDEQLEQFIVDMYNTCYAIGYQEAYADMMRTCTSVMVQTAGEINDITGLYYNDYDEESEEE